MLERYQKTKNVAKGSIMTGQYLLAIDQGTTGTTALVLDVCQKDSPEVLAKFTVDFTQYYPNPGWVEHDLEEIWKSVDVACQQVMSLAASKSSQFLAKDILAIGITNQRETLCTFERGTGLPLCPAIVWQCKRSAGLCQKLKKDGLENLVRNKTGLLLDPYFTGTKMTWVTENYPDVASKLKNGQAIWGTVDSYLLYRLSGCLSFATEGSNASRTLLYNIDTGSYDQDLCKILKIPSRSSLPEVRDSAGIFGRTKGLSFLPDGIPIAGILGDQQAALAGQAGFELGDAKCTFGTGAFMLLNTGDKKLFSSSGLLTTVAWSLDNKLTYAFEGASFIAGAAMQFLRDQLDLLQSAPQSEELSRGVVAAPEVYFVPALAGLGAPYWNPEAKGAFLGLSRGVTKGQLVRAALEGIAFQVYELFSSMKKDFPNDAKLLRVDGGAASNDLLMQIQANIAGISVDRPVNLETTAAGAAFFAGLGIGLYSDLNELKTARKSAKIFMPEDSADALDLRKRQLDGWRRAIEAVQIFSGGKH